MKGVKAELEATVNEKISELTAQEAKISELKDALSSEAADKLFMEVGPVNLCIFPRQLIAD